MVLAVHERRAYEEYAHHVDQLPRRSSYFQRLEPLPSESDHELVPYATPVVNPPALVAQRDENRADSDGHRHGHLYSETSKTPVAHTGATGFLLSYWLDTLP
jgi:hypothetical protein